MLAITVYSDQIPVEIIAGDPMLQDIYANDEREEQSEFEEILAGIMNAGSAETSESESSLDTLALEKTEDGSRLNIFTNEADKNQAANLITEINAKFETVPQTDREIDADVKSDLSGIKDTEHLLYGSSDAENESETLLENLTQGFDVQTLDDLAQLASISFSDINPQEANENLQADASLISEKVKNDSAVQKNAATETAQVSQQAQSSQKTESEKLVGTAALDEKKNAKESQSQAEGANVLPKNEKAESAFNSKTGDDAQAKQNDTPGKLDEHRSRIRKEKVSFEVQDLRKNTSSQTSAVNAAALGETARAGGNVQEVTLDLRLGDAAQQNSQAQTSWDVKSGAAMENLLARELHQNFNGDIVRHASMILRNGGEGIIRLALHPETLGNVKIHLEMAENKITGHIFVESEESLNAFRKEIAALEQAFKDSGFAEATLDLSLSGGGEQNNDNEQPSFFAINAALNYEDSYDAETSPVIDVFFGRRSGTINMLA